MKNARFPRRAVSILATMILPAVGYANPKGGEVKAGAATFESGPNSLTIRQSSDRGIIHWQDFSIGQAETTRFIQPNSNSATLNRVVGGIPSSIHGTLNANGKVYLINPNGILVGPSGRINTASFVASTLDVPDAEFLAGANMHFKGTSTAGVVNLGTITATNGDVVLMGHTVQNAGTISAPNGVAALGAGNDIVLQVAGDERIVVNSGIASGAGTGVLNSGAIQAAQAELKAAGGNVYALAVHNNGIVRATGVFQKNGRIILGSSGGVVQNTGHLIAKNANGSGGHVRMVSGKGGHTIQNGVIDAAGGPGQNGGTIELLGDTVSVGATSLMDVSGANAGLISIGVDAATASLATADHGIDSVIEDQKATDPTSLDTAQQTFIEAGSRILASSTSAGQGGHVVVWSDRQSTVGGTIEAKGGTLGGDGGFVETSGHFGLTVVTGTKVDASAAKGASGTWLMDPAGITIDAGPTDTSVSTFASPPESDYNQNAATNHVAASDIVAALSGGSNVLVRTSNSFANRDLNVNAAIVTGTLALNSTTNLAPKLNLIASNGDVNINAAIGGAGTNLIFAAQSNGSGINVASTGSVIASGISFSSGGNISIAGLVSALNDKTISMITTSGGIAFTGVGKAQTTANGFIFLNTSGNATGTITDAGTTSLSTFGLGISAGAKGVGTSASPLHISVSHFDATVNDNGLTTGTGGGVFVSNSGGDLHIAGSDPHNFSGLTLTGISVPNIQGFGGIEVTNTGGDVLVDAAFVDRVTAYGNIKLTSATSSAVKITTADPDTVHSFHGTVELDGGTQAAGSVIIGDSNHTGVNVRGAAGVIVRTGGNLVVTGSILKANGGNGVDIVTGGDITVQKTSNADARIGTSGGVVINLTTGAGHQVVNNGGSTGGITTQLADDTDSTVTTDGAPIFIKTDSITLSAQLNGGNHGTVNITPVSLHTGINLGLATKNVAGQLGLTSAEINQIFGGSVDLFTSSTNDGAVQVSGAIALGGLNFGQITLEAGGGGGITISQSIDTDSADLVLNALNGGAVTGAGSVITDDLIVNVPGAGVNLTGVVNTTSITFHTQSTAKFTNPANTIDKIKASSTGAQGIDVEDHANLTVTGAVSTTGQALIATDKEFDIAIGGSITAPSIILNVSQGAFGNFAGANSLQGSYVVYLLLRGQSELNGLAGTDYTAAPVLPYSNPASPSSDVFYYRNLTAPPTNVVYYTPPPVTIAAPRLFSSVPAQTPDQVLKDFRRMLASLSLTDLVKLTADPAVLADPIKKNELLSQVNTLNNNMRYPLSKAAQDAIVAQAARDIQAQAASILTQKQAVLSSKLYPTVLNMSDPAVAGAFSGNGLMAAQANINLSSFSLDQLATMGRDQVLAMLGSAGVQLSAADKKTATAATMSQDQLSKIITSGNGLTVPQFSSLIAAGGGNLTINQLVAAGGGNLITQDGGGIISHDGGGLVVVDRFGAIISHDGGGLTVFALASLITQDGGGIISHDGGGIISHDGGGIISHDGGGIISHDGGGLITQDGGGLLSQISSLITQDGGGILAGRNELVTGVAQGIISHDGGGVISNDGAGLMGSGFNSSLMSR